jgi:hypothetical protein
MVAAAAATATTDTSRTAIHRLAPMKLFDRVDPRVIGRTILGD